MATDLYIDTIRLQGNSGVYFDDKTTTVSSSGVVSTTASLSTSNTTMSYVTTARGRMGLKWCVQLTARKAITAADLTRYRFAICTRYLHHEESPAETESFGSGDIFYKLGKNATQGMDPDATPPTNNKYLGWDMDGHTVENDTTLYISGESSNNGIDTQAIYIPDQYKEDTNPCDLIISTDFYLQYTSDLADPDAWERVQTVGSNAFALVDGNFFDKTKNPFAIMDKEIKNSVSEPYTINTSSPAVVGTLGYYTINASGPYPTTSGDLSVDSSGNFVAASGNAMKIVLKASGGAWASLSSFPYNFRHFHTSETSTSDPTYYYQVFDSDGSFAHGEVDDPLGASAFGDPHVTTLDGVSYDFEYKGTMRYFDNGEENDRFLINVLCENSKYPRWSENGYYTKIFIQHKDKNMLVDVGFRGDPVTILENNGFEVNEKSLNFDSSAKRYCTVCPRVQSQREHRCNSHINITGHEMPKFIRNQISLDISTETGDYKLFLENVNEFNLQPGRIFLQVDAAIDRKNFSGLIANKSWAPYSVISNIKDTNKLSKSKFTTLSEPKITIKPQEINLKWK